MTADAFSGSISATTSHSPTIEIRRARREEIEAVAEVITHSFHSCQGFGILMYPFLKLGIYEDIRLRVIGNDPNYACFVATALPTATAGGRETITGAVEIAGNFTHTPVPKPRQAAYISNLAVSPNYRRKGIARRLLQTCEQLTAQWGCEEIFLHVLETNRQALRLYEQCGYHLYRIEPSLMALIFNKPRRLLLRKSINSSYSP